MNEMQVMGFLAVAEEGNFSRAAEKIYMAQPNLSRSIAKLENELNILLFDRSGKTVVLTEAGKLYYEFFKRMELGFKDVGIHAKLLSHGRQGNIRFGYMEGWKISRFLAPVLRKIEKEYPGIIIRVETYSYRELLEKLENEELDLILTMDSELYNENVFRRQEIAEVQQVLLYSSYYPFFRENMQVKDFSGAKFYVMDEEGKLNLGDKIRRYCERYSFIPQIEFVKNMDSVLANVEAGNGVMICDKWTRCVEAPDLYSISLDIYHRISFGWKITAKNVAIALFINEFEKALEDALYQK